MFAKLYLISEAATEMDQYCAQHSESDPTWEAMKDLPYRQVARTKHHTDAAFQKLCLKKQGPNRIIKSFSAYIVTLCVGTNITDFNKLMFL
jgi:hypothetical protein